MKKTIACILLVAMLASLLTGCCLSHEWTEATCANPQTCAECGKTKGDTLPHTWVEATCAVPKTCSVCGSTEGDTLEHTWLDATCAEPQTCSECGAKEGQALGHTFEAATCTKAKTCSVCNHSTGNPLPHNYEWVNTKEPTYSAEGEKTGTCVDCGATTTETIAVIIPEYHWNKPLQITDELTVGMYKDGKNYWVELKTKTVDTSTILTILRYGMMDLGFDTDYLWEWAVHIAESAQDTWDRNGITYAELSGYGREWVLYMDMREGKPGVFGVKINMESELESLLDIDITD